MSELATIHQAEDVRKFAATILSDFDRCDHGEGTECISLDAKLEHYAVRCRRLWEQTRKWGIEVFSGRTPFDESVEKAWRTEGEAVYENAYETLELARQRELFCYSLPGAHNLTGALCDLYDLLTDWVTPRLAVSPSARQSGSFDDRLPEAKKILSTLPPLPADWMPEDKVQRSMIRKATNV